MNDQLVGFRIKFSGSHGTQYDDLIISGKHTVVFPQLRNHDFIFPDSSDLSDEYGPRHSYTLIVKQDKED